MKKKIIFFLMTLALTLTLRNISVYAWPEIDIKLPNYQIPIITSTPTPTTAQFIKVDPSIFKLFISSSPSITQSPSQTPTLTPTINISLTTMPTKEITTSINPTSTQEAKTTTTPTKNQESKNINKKDLIYKGAIGILALIILIQAWPAIKKFLYDKTA